MKLPSESSIQIVVLDRGFVFVGKTTRTDEFMYIDNAFNIRKWGTTDGLGQLRNGPTKETVLDDSGTIRAPMRAVIFTIDCDDSKWTPLLN